MGKSKFPHSSPHPLSAILTSASPPFPPRRPSSCLLPLLAVASILTSSSYLAIALTQTLAQTLAPQRHGHFFSRSSTSPFSSKVVKLAVKVCNLVTNVGPSRSATSPVYHLAVKVCFLFSNHSGRVCNIAVEFARRLDLLLRRQVLLPLWHV